MNAARALVGLYPAPVRERWGADLAEQLEHTGPAEWLDTVRGALVLWTHPATWPQRTAVQARRTVASTAVAIVLAAGLSVRGLGPQFTDVHRPAGLLWVVLLMIGLAAVVPVPRLRPGALSRLGLAIATGMSGPAVALLVLFGLGNSGLLQHPALPAEIALRTLYWGTLLFTGVRACVVAGRLDERLARPAGLRRTTWGLQVITAGLAVGAGTAGFDLTTGGPRLSIALVAAAFAGLAVLAAQTVRDLRVQQPPDPGGRLRDLPPGY